MVRACSYLDGGWDGRLRRVYNMTALWVDMAGSCIRWRYKIKEVTVNNSGIQLAYYF